MSRRIQILPDAVANQIAAGEAVERPASVVKELVENALDAGATRVDIAIERGGKRRIRVSDDGVGMSRDDALLSLDRHATSKIAEAGDLTGVRTFGFRGEALPSIAAVSRMALETWDGEDESGTRVTVNGGRISDLSDVARRRGTTVDVRNLFHNAPVRARFLKSVSAEARAVAEAATALALANPRVAFHLTSDDRVLLDLPSTEDVASRVARIWGGEHAGTLIPAGHDDGDMSLRGLVQRPDAAKPGFRRNHLFVNGRPFRSTELVRAAERGYRTTIPQGVRPWMFLYLRLPGPQVDVNVHPTKAEVRFREPGRVEELVERAVRSALDHEASAATFDRELGSARMSVREGTDIGRSGAGTGGEAGGPGGGRGAEPGGAGTASSGSRPEGTASDRTASGALAAADGRPADGPEERSPGDRRSPGEDAGRSRGIETGTAADAQMALFVASAEEGAGTATAGDEDVGGGEGGPMAPLPEAGARRPRLWQVLDTYVLAETRDGILIVDQHAAHERILFQRLMDSFEAGGQESQRLLFPLTLRLTPPEVEMIEDLGGLLARAGFEVEGFGGDTVIVQAVPNPHRYFDAERAFREMVHELTHGSELVRSARNQHERIAMTFACKSAIKAGQKLSEPEMQELFDQLFATELPHHDVHGRPTVVRLSATELRRKFGRS